MKTGRELMELAAKAAGITLGTHLLDEYRVWPDGTVQEASEPPYSWLSDDYLTVRAEDEEAALAKADRAYPREA